MEGSQGSRLRSPILRHKIGDFFKKTIFFLHLYLYLGSKTQIFLRFVGENISTIKTLAPEAAS
jgi:hypothetical protein